MRKRKQAARPRALYKEQQLTGLRLHTQAQKQQMVNRLRTAMMALMAQHKPISARTIYEECGLAYAASDIILKRSRCTNNTAPF